MKSDLETVWRGLSNPVRRRVLDLLRDGPRTTGELAESFPELSRFAVMQHLGVLQESGLLLVRREGRRRLNYLNAVPLRQIYERWVSVHAGMAAETAFRLKEHVERQKGVSMPTSGLDSDAGRIVKIETEIRLEAPQERVFAALTTEMDAWWPFRFCPDGRLVLEACVGGRCYEDWGNGQGAFHGTVVWYEPPHKIVATGPSAMGKGVSAFDVQSVVPDGDGSIYRKSLTLWGAVTDDLERMFTEGSKAILFQHLKAYVEGGVRYTPSPT